MKFLHNDSFQWVCGVIFAVSVIGFGLHYSERIKQTEAKLELLGNQVKDLQIRVEFPLK